MFKRGKLKIRVCLLLVVASLMLSGCASSPKSGSVTATNAKDFSQFVNPFIGTDGTGHTFPGAAYPFGMVQLSPDTDNHSWDHTSGYQYRDQSIMGFSHNHLSGTGVSDLGDVLLQPFVNGTPAESFRSQYEKSSEQASPGYYSVRLSDHKVDVELTASEHVGFHQYHYLEADGHQLFVNLQHGIINAWQSLTEHVNDSAVEIEDKYTLSGFIETTAWVRHKTFFVIKFSQPFASYRQLPVLAGEKAPKYVFDFAQLDDQRLKAKVALSTVSVAGAKNNLRTEVPHWDFDRVHKQARSAWNRYLSRIEIDAPLRQKQIFYTGLYHLFLQPNNTADVDGKYRGYDDQVYQATGDGHFSTLSIWDTYRAAHPLYTLLVPEKVDEFVNSMIAQHPRQGFLPIWGLMNKETYTMIGNHAIPVVVDAVLKGIPGIDAEAAYNAVLETSTISHKNSDWELYERYGYYPFDKLGPDGESVSRTLESSYDDFAVAQLAKHLGKQQDLQKFTLRSEFYRNLFDPSTGFMRGKDSQGNWRPDFDPLEATSPMNNPGDYTEANAYQYSWAAQHATPGMIELFGSKRKFAAKLDEFFTVTNDKADKHLGQEAMIGQYAHGNEPSHHIAYLYQFADRPQRTEQLVRRIYNDFYDNTPDGIQGNEDCGQMSAWYIFATLGFYPVDPSNGEYVFGAPQVNNAIIHLQNGNTFSISKRAYAESVKTRWPFSLNGKTIESIMIHHADIVKGGELQYDVSP